MPSKTEFGSKTWLDTMFVSPPARIVKGRTRWTHRHAPWVDCLGRLAFVESRNELIGFLVLEYLYRIKKVVRLKEQPFTTEENIFGQEYTPDLCAKDDSGTTYVIEVKTDRFLSREDKQGFEKMNQQFAEVGMKFLLWTDCDPLIRPLRHNMLRLRKASTENIHSAEVDHLIDILGSNGPMPLWALYDKDMDIDLISYAVWNAKVFLPLASEINTMSMVSLSPTENLASVVFAAEPDLNAWWNTLEGAA